jgi:serine/threonine protein kinase
MINCPKCATELTLGAKFCYSCGHKMPDSNLDLDQDRDFLKRTLEPKFIEIQKIGQGGMGSIFLGKQVSLNRKVVIKLLNASLALDEILVENFLKEAQIAANIKHPNIVEMVDYGKAEGRPFFIMEYGEKGSLEKILSELNSHHKKLPSLDVCKSMIKILRALDFAHSKNLLAHRDIKPHNIILRESDDLFITDFGIALDKSQKKNINVESAGTLDYMSPEQIQGSKDIDQRSDIYSLGILFFEMLTCSLPFESVDKDKLKQMHLHSEIPELKLRFTKEELKKITKEEIDLESLQLIIRRACEKDKSKRYSSCREMADEIESIVQKIEEKKTESYKKNRKLIAIYSLIAGSLAILFSYVAARYFIIETCANCCVVGDCKNGKGKYVYAPQHPNDPKNIYEGEFKNGKKHGKGEYLMYSVKAKYEGSFIDGEFYGYGTLTNFSDNDLETYSARYSGYFKNNQPDGQGAYYFNDGSYFAGQFVKGEPNGKLGIFYTKDQSLYKGDIHLVDGQMIPEGKGTILLSGERVYIGEFHDGKLHGYGRLIQSDGSVISGNWEHGKIVIKRK